MSYQVIQNFDAYGGDISYHDFDTQEKALKQAKFLIGMSQSKCATLFNKSQNQWQVIFKQKSLTNQEDKRANHSRCKHISLKKTATSQSSQLKAQHKILESNYERIKQLNNELQKKIHGCKLQIKDQGFTWWFADPNWKESTKKCWRTASHAYCGQRYSSGVNFCQRCGPQVQKLLVEKEQQIINKVYL